MYRLADHAAAVFATVATEAGIEPGYALSAACSARFCPVLRADYARKAWHGPILAVASRRPILGITLGEVVYVAGDEALTSWPLIAHETAHVAQFYRRGTPAFLGRYALEYLRNRSRGMPDHDAYLALSDEVEARRVERLAMQSGAPSGTWLVPYVAR